MLQPNITNTYEPDLSLSFSDKQQAFSTFSSNLPNISSYNEFDLLYDTVPVSSLAHQDILRRRTRTLNDTEQLNRNSSATTNFKNDINDSCLSSSRIYQELGEPINRRTIAYSPINNSSQSLVPTMPVTNPILTQYKSKKETVRKEDLNIDSNYKISYLDLRRSYLQAKHDEEIKNRRHELPVTSLEMRLTRGDINRMREYVKTQTTPQPPKTQVLDYISSLRNVFRQSSDTLADDNIRHDNINLRQLYNSCVSFYHEKMLKSNSSVSSSSRLLERSIVDTLQRNKNREKIAKLSYIKLNNKFTYNIPIKQYVDTNMNASIQGNTLLKHISSSKSPEMLYLNSKNKSIKMHIDVIKTRSNLPFRSQFNSSKCASDEVSDIKLTDMNSYRLMTTMSRTDKFDDYLRSMPSVYSYYRFKQTGSNKFHLYDSSLIRKQIDLVCASLSMKNRLSTRTKFYIQYDQNRSNIAKLASDVVNFRTRPDYSVKFDASSIISDKRGVCMDSVSPRLRETADRVEHFNSSDNDIKLQVSTQMVSTAFSPYHLVDEPLGKRADYFHS